jgi:mono/diheme cytochrome c family protein
MSWTWLVKRPKLAQTPRQDGHRGRRTTGTEMTMFTKAVLAGAAALALASCQATAPPMADAPAAPATPAIAAPTHDIAPAPQQVAGTAAHPGESVYKTYCAACHDQPEATRSPAKDTLKQMSLLLINFALTEGKMKAQGALLSAEQRAQVVNYLIGAKQPANSWTSAMMCDAARMPVDLAGGPTITNFGYDMHNTRSLTAAQAGLTAVTRRRR